MPLEITKQRRETSPALVRRFIKQLRQSGILQRARKIQFNIRPKSRALRKRAALRRASLQKEREKLKKLGKTIK